MFSLIFYTIFTVLIALILWKCTYWQRNGVKGPRGLPLVGSMLHYVLARKHYGDIYEEIYNDYPDLPYIGFYRIFNEPSIILRSQEMIKEVMIRNFQHFQDNVLWVDPARNPIVIGNPFIAKGEKWRTMRQEIMPIFTPNKVKSSFSHIEIVCKKLQIYVEENLKIENCFEAKNLFSKYTLDVVASAAYGLDAQSFTNSKSDFTQLVENLFLPNPYSLLETTALLFSPLLANLIKYTYVPRSVTSWLKSIITNVLNQRLVINKPQTPAVAAEHSDFIQWLIENKQKSKEPVNQHSILSHCSTFLLEGFETSSSLMAFALYEYAINPLQQQKILSEIDEVLQHHNGQLTYEALQEMLYLEASLYETLRLHPAMAALVKHCTKTFCLPAQLESSTNQKGFRIPQGMVCVVPVKAVHYNPNIYPDPYDFKPERFLDDKEKRQSCTFLGFGEGPRMCPGGRFALVQSKAGIVALLRRYSVHLADKAKEKPFKISPTTFLTATQNGIWLSFKLRKEK